MKSLGTKCLLALVASEAPEDKCDTCGNDQNPQSNSETNSIYFLLVKL